MSLRIVAGTIVAKNYLAYARAWARSFREHHPDSRVVVLLSDRNDGEIDPSVEPFDLLEAEALGVPGFLQMALRYDVMELSTALKPAFLERLLEGGDEDAAIYFDPDILVLAPLTPVLDALETANVVLTPHSIAPVPVDGHRPTEVAFLISGAYNLGFIAVRRSPESARMLEWWGKRLERGGASAPEQGLFTDQKWIDLVPSFFSDVRILRDPTLNVAYWNLHERSDISKADGTFVLRGEPIRFFHFSGFVSDAPDLVSKHQDRFQLSALHPAIRELFAIFGAAIRREGQATTRRFRYAYGEFEDGEPIAPQMRAAFRAAETDGASWRDPFKVGDGSFREWALRPGIGRVAVCPFAKAIWESRADVRAVFPRGLNEQAPELLEWIAEAGLRELRVGPAILDGLRPRPVPVVEATGNSLPDVAHAVPSLKNFLDYDPVLFSWELVGYMVPPGSSLPRFLERAVGAEVYRRLRFRYWCLTKLSKRLFAAPRWPDPPVQQKPTNEELPIGVAPRVVITPVEAPFGVNVFGYLDTESGIAEVARCFVNTLTAAGVPVAPITLPQPWLRREDHSIHHTATTTPFPVNLFFVNADQLPEVIDARRAILDGRRSVGYFFWELEEFPERFDPALRLVDEVWVASTFCQRSIAARSDVPVVCVPPTIDCSKWPGPDRAGFELADDDFVFLSVFDAASYTRRKNPEAAIAAFKRAFPSRGQEILFLKTVNATGAQIETLERLAAGSRIRIVNGYATREEILSLHASSDACVSLHRGEGLGLSLLEAMAYAKPVIATAYGGPVDFLRPDAAMMVPYRRVPVGPDAGPYAERALWAEPDVEFATARMRELASCRRVASRLGELGHVAFREWGTDAGATAKYRIEKLARAARPFA